MLGALAHTDRAAIVELLLQRPATQAEIRDALDLQSGTASKHLRMLEERRLVTRPRSHSPYELIAPGELLVVLEAAVALSVATSRRQLETDEARQRSLRKVRMRRGADIEGTQDRLSMPLLGEDRSFLCEE